MRSIFLLFFLLLNIGIAFGQQAVQVTSSNILTHPTATNFYAANPPPGGGSSTNILTFTAPLVLTGTNVAITSYSFDAYGAATGLLSSSNNWSATNNFTHLEEGGYIINLGGNLTTTGAITLGSAASENISYFAPAFTGTTNQVTLGTGAYEAISSLPFSTTTGTLTSVALSMGGQFTVTGSPITGAGGTFTVTSPSFLQDTNNLSDLTSASTARTNLGLGSLSTSNSITMSLITGLGSGVATAAANAVNTTGGFLTVGGLNLTTTGSSGPATLSGTNLNIPQYSGGGGGSITLGTNNAGALTLTSNVLDFLNVPTGTGAIVENSNSTLVNMFANSITATTGGSFYIYGSGGPTNTNVATIKIDTSTHQNILLITPAGGAINLDGILEANTNVMLNGTLSAGSSGVGTSNQVLSSTVSGVAWVAASSGGTNYLGVSPIVISGSNISLTNSLTQNYALSGTNTFSSSNSFSGTSTFTGSIVSSGTNKFSSSNLFSGLSIFTGTADAITQTTGDTSTNVATDKFVANAVGSLVTGVSSVTNSDGNVIVSPPTGSVVVNLNNTITSTNSNGFIFNANGGSATAMTLNATGTGDYDNIFYLLNPDEGTGKHISALNFGANISAYNNAASFIFLYNGSNSTANQVQLCAFGNVTPLMSWALDGDVMINSATDNGYGLEVNGTERVDGSLTLNGAFKDSTGASGTSNQVLSTTASGTLWINSGGGSSYTSTGDVIISGSNVISLTNTPLQNYAFLGTISAVTQATGDTSTNVATDQFAAQAVQRVSGGTAFFGGGFDGNVTITTNVTLTRDMYYNNLTISGTNGELKTAGWRVFASGILDVSAANTNAIYASGGNGTVGSATGAGGNAGLLAGVGSLEGGGPAGNGVTGTTTTGSPAASLGVQTAYIGGACGNSGKGGNGSAGAGGAGSADGAVSLNYVDFYSTTYFRLAAALYGGLGAQGGAGGGGDGTNSGAGGGGSGAGGGIIWIAANTINVGSNTNSPIIECVGGNGNAGGSPTLGNTGGGSGGAGGGGGFVTIYLNSETGTPIANGVNVSGGNGGNGGTGKGSGTGGGGSNSGASGTYQEISMSAGTNLVFLTPIPSIAGTTNSGTNGGTGGTATNSFGNL